MDPMNGGNGRAEHSAPQDPTRVDSELSRDIVRKRAQLRAVIDAIPDHISAKDDRGVYWLCNRAFSEYVGRDPRSVVGHTDAELFDPEAARRRSETDHLVLREEKTLRSESWEESVDGETTLLDTLEAPFYNLEGELLGLIEVSRDITERHRMEEELRRARDRIAKQYAQLKELESLRDSLTHMIIHDMRSPLTGIVTSLRLMHMDSEDMDESLAEDLARALRSATQLNQMITGVLDVSKMEAGEMVLQRNRHDLAETAQAALDFLGGLLHARNVSIEHDGPIEGCYDESLVTRMLSNLVSNALRFTPVEGSVTIHLGRVGGGVRVEVRDTGVGIPKEQQSRVFHKFAQVGSEGARVKVSTGLGLAFCRLAAEAHGGSIGVVSAVAEGSTFWFELPDTGCE